MRYERTRILEYLDESISITSEAVEAAPKGHPLRPSCLQHEGHLFGRRFEATRVPADLDRAIEALTMAVDETPKDHPDRSDCLSKLSTWLLARFEHSGVPDAADLGRAIEAATTAVESTPSEHPNRAFVLHNLRECFYRRAKLARSLEDWEQMLACELEAWCCESAPPSIRIGIAISAAMQLAAESNWDAASTLLQQAIGLIPSLTPRTLAHTDKQHLLERLGSLGPDAAAAALNAGQTPCDAVQLLEAGRGIIAGSLGEMRGNISALKQLHPELADEFESLRDELDLVSAPITEAVVGISSPTSSSSLCNPVTGTVPTPMAQVPITTAETLLDSAARTTPSWEVESKRRRETENHFDQLLADIRTEAGFGNFLRSPSGNKLRAAAEHGPIAIVNVSLYRCDAFLIQRDQTSVLPLTKKGVTLKVVKEHIHNIRASRQSSSSRALRECLKWLWVTIARPCLDALGFKEPISNTNDADWPRVWWIPTGPLSHLPLHAAGGYETSGDTVLDRVMSSYALSVKTMLFGRQSNTAYDTSAVNLGQTKSDHALLVAMGDTPGLSWVHKLKFATKEVEMLKAMTPSLNLKPLTLGRRKAEILESLRSCALFHFAGHGRVDLLEPSRSCLLLDDWEENPLTAGDLRDCKFQHSPPFLAFLSACSTGTSMNDKLDNEGVHLVSAFQLAGFRHVVGTLWEVKDEQCGRCATVKYEGEQSEVKETLLNQQVRVKKR